MKLALILLALAVLLWCRRARHSFYERFAQ
jgi:hypothetical protein